MKLISEYQYTFLQNQSNLKSKSVKKCTPVYTFDKNSEKMVQKGTLFLPFYFFGVHFSTLSRIFGVHRCTPGVHAFTPRPKKCTWVKKRCTPKN